MNLRDYIVRNKTYIAGDWTGDSDAISQLYKWNDGDKWSFHFIDVHSYSSSYDSSMPCSIKESLRIRMSKSKLFVLVVGKNTDSLRKGACAYYNCFNAKKNMFPFEYYECTVKGKTYSTQSFVKYECELARKLVDKNEIKVVVLYNSTSVNKGLCPESMRDVGVHVAMKQYDVWRKEYSYDYQAVKLAIEGNIK